MIITFTDPDSANKAILNGLVICNKKVSVAKCKREPIRCLKCQGHNHVANECIIQRDICAKCGDSHRTSSCDMSILYCTPCGARGHASSTRIAPPSSGNAWNSTPKTPKNTLPFFPSTEPWTWEATPPSGQRTAIPVELTDYICPNRSGQMRQMQLPYQSRQIAPNGRELERHSWDRQETEETNE